MIYTYTAHSKYTVYMQINLDILICPTLQKELANNSYIAKNNQAVEI